MARCRPWSQRAMPSVPGERRRPRRTAPVTVEMRGGVYRLDAPFVLEPKDSGSSERPVVYRAFQQERPVLSGGRLLTGFHQHGPLWECAISEVKSGRWYFRQLFADGQRCPPARSPNGGYYRIAGFLPGRREAGYKDVPNKSGFIFSDAEIQDWPRLHDVNIILMHSWETSIHPLQSVDPLSHEVRFTAPLKEWWSLGYWEKSQRYYLENAREFLDQPGEWYLNRQTGVLSYFPRPGERLDATEIVAPRLQELVRFAGDPEGGRPVHHVTLQGLEFRDSDWELSPQGNSSTQAAVEVPAVIMADGADDCVIDHCTVAHIGTYGIWFRHGCHDCRLTNNRLFDLGAGGIRIGETKMARTDAAESRGNLLENNEIFDGGRVYAAGVGIWVAQSSHNRIAHNEVHDLLYSGISIGWNWNDQTNRCHHNIIEWNHVHDLVNGVLSDAGAIYTLGASPGSVIRNNVFHDIWPYDHPPFGWGIYLDATCSGYLVESNIVYNTRSGGLMFNNGGHAHVIRNNIFAASTDLALWPYWHTDTNVFRRNIVYLTQGKLFTPNAKSSLQERLAAHQPLGIWDNNLYWRPGGADQLDFLGHTFSEWQALGLDQHSKIADPRFVDAAHFDFRLRPDSPAFDLGFHALHPSRAGLIR